MASKMTGIKEMRRAVKRMPEDLREEVGTAIKATVDAVHAKGKANIAATIERQTGNLAKNYRKSFSRKSLNGRVGYLSKAARRKAWYARFVHDGTVKMAARPFHDNALDAEKERGELRITIALNRVIDKLARAK